MIAIIRYGLAFLWTGLLVFLSTLVLLVTFQRKWSVQMARTMWAPGILWICRTRLQIEGLKNLKDLPPAIFVANHRSFLDIPVLFRAVPVNLHFVAKKEIRTMPFVGWYMWATGMIFIDRQNREKAIQSLARAGELIRKGKNVIMFPEGGRARSAGIQPFKKGPFVLARENELPIVPVALINTDKIVPPDNVTEMYSGTVVVRFGKPIQSSSASRLEDLIEEARGQIIDLYG